MMTKLYLKVISANSGQGALETAVICEPFSLEWEV